MTTGGVFAVMRKRSWLVAALLALPYVTLAAPRKPEPVPLNQWEFVPGVRVGAITARTSESDLARIFGGEHVERRPLPAPDGGWRLGTVVLGKTHDALEILWRDSNFTTPERIIIGGGKTRWRSADGITIGTTLQDLAKLNGRPFQLRGFGREGGGMVVSWEGGRLGGDYRLGETVLVRLGPDQDFGELTDGERRQILGSGTVSSATPSLAKLGVRVWEIVVLFR
jgi:hypothetical protein